MVWTTAQITHWFIVWGSTCYRKGVSQNFIIGITISKAVQPLRNQVFDDDQVVVSGCWR
jgi:hypothetical protein